MTRSARWKVFIGGAVIGSFFGAMVGVAIEAHYVLSVLAN